MKFLIDGKEREALAGDTIMEAARRVGVFIPGLCYSEKVESTNCCRLCMVEVWEKERPSMVAACAYKVKEGLSVVTESENLLKVRKTMLKLLYAQAPQNPEILRLMNLYGAAPEVRIPIKEGDCILCGLCVAACDKMGIRAISTVNRGTTKAVDTPYGEEAEGCIGCASCAEICPTGCIPVEDSQEGRIMWNKTFQWQRCQVCGEILGTRQHWEAAKETEAEPLCTRCRQRSITGVMAGVFGE